MFGKKNNINDLLIEIENISKELKNVEDSIENQNGGVENKLKEYDDKINLSNQELSILKENVFSIQDSLFRLESNFNKQNQLQIKRESKYNELFLNLRNEQDNTISNLIEERGMNKQALIEKDNLISTLQEVELDSKNQIFLLNDKISEITSDNENRIKRISEEKNIEIDKILNEKESQIKKLNTQLSELNSKVEDSDQLIVNNLKQLTTKVNSIELSIKEQQEQTKLIINSQNDLKSNLNKLTSIFIENYNETRKYFFNNQENILKKYFDTNDFFKLCYFNNFKFISYSPAENRILIKTDDGIIFGCNNRFYTLKEVIGFNGYSIPQLYDFDEFIVFDVGMNRSYASLWFANFENCKHVYGFEIDPDTYNKALSNINLNPHLANKITPHNFGLSNQNEEVDLFYVEGCDGVNTMLREVVELQPELQDENKLNKKRVHVKKSSEILSKIIKDNNIRSKIVLKIDTEGAEYNIISDLIETDVISKIDVLLGEGHLFKRKHFCDELKERGFIQIDLQINPITYHFAFVKEKYFNVWPLKK